MIIFIQRTKMDNNSIGIFDSGVGGATVLKEIRKKLPNENYIYLGDNKRFPYGSKSKDEIIKYTEEALKFFEKRNSKIMVIACGTATSQALEEVSKIAKIPVIGVISPTVEYLKSKESKNIGVIATKGSIQSGNWTKSLEEGIQGVNVIAKACPLLASLVEEGWINSKATKIIVKEYLKDMKKIDALILGCTHYPLLEDVIKKCVSNKTEIINTGTCVAEKLFKILSKENMKNESNVKGNLEIYFTDTQKEASKTISRLLEEKIETVKVDIE